MGAGTEGVLNKGSKSSAPASPSMNTQGLATLIVMIAVLTIIIMFCCFAAPGVRDLCKRYIFRTCVIDDPDEDNVSSTGEPATPTIILLPYGRMLIVDRSVFAQLQADRTGGIDFMELGASLMRAQRRQTSSATTPSADTSKGLSPISMGVSPPAYEDIFGDAAADKGADLPPSYSEVSFMFRTADRGHRVGLGPAELNHDSCDHEIHDDTNSVRVDVGECVADDDRGRCEDCSLKESSL